MKDEGTVFPEQLSAKIAEALVSCQVLFPDRSAAPPFFDRLMQALAAMREDIRSGRTEHLLAEPCGEDGPDSVTLLNLLSGSLPPGVFFSSCFDNTLLDELSRRFPGADLSSLEKNKGDISSDCAFCFRHARRLAELLGSLIPD